MIYEQIKTGIKEAMKCKDTSKRDVLKMVVNKAQLSEKEANPNGSSDGISDEIMEQALRKELKQLEQTRDALAGKKESELYKETIEKINIVSMYLPKMMSREEIDEAVKIILSSGDYTSFGQKMKIVMQALKGKADNRIIKEVVERYK